jgi:hypothetical protein
MLILLYNALWLAAILGAVYGLVRFAKWAWVG